MSCRSTAAGSLPARFTRRAWSIYRLLVFPVVVCPGKRLFDEAFTVDSAETTGAGATSLTMRPTGFGAGDLAVKDGKESVA